MYLLEDSFVCFIPYPWLPQTVSIPHLSIQSFPSTTTYFLHIMTVLDFVLFSFERLLCHFNLINIFGRSYWFIFFSLTVSCWKLEHPLLPVLQKVVFQSLNILLTRSTSKFFANSRRVRIWSCFQCLREYIFKAWTSFLQAQVEFVTYYLLFLSRAPTPSCAQGDIFTQHSFLSQFTNCWNLEHPLLPVLEKVCLQSIFKSSEMNFHKLFAG